MKAMTIFTKELTNNTKHNICFYLLLLLEKITILV